jgi:hypothetical protein
MTEKRRALTLEEENAKIDCFLDWLDSMGEATDE